MGARQTHKIFDFLLAAIRDCVGQVFQYMFTPSTTFATAALCNRGPESNKQTATW